MDGQAEGNKEGTELGGWCKKGSHGGTPPPATPTTGILEATNSPKKFRAISDQDSLCSCSAGFGQFW